MMYTYKNCLSLEPLVDMVSPSFQFYGHVTEVSAPCGLEIELLGCGSIGRVSREVAQQAVPGSRWCQRLRLRS